MEIAKYEAAKNAYTQTPRKYHVRAVTVDGLTESEDKAWYRGTWNTKKEAEQVAKELNEGMVNTNG